MKISTIIPTYNRSCLLLRAVESVQDQDYSDVKIVVRDNASVDDTSSVIKDLIKTDKRIELISLSENIGAHENIRQGIKNVETEFFSFLCDDDFLAPGFYAEGMRLFDEYPSASFVVFPVDIVSLDGRVVSSNLKKYKHWIYPKYFTPQEGIRAYLRNELPCTLTGFLFRREVATSIDFGDFPEVGYGADILFIWRAASRFNFVVSDIKGGSYTAHEGNTSSTMVNAFDERFLYWWKNRIRLMLKDKEIMPDVGKAIEDFYFSESRVRYPHKLYYFLSACNLISKRLALNELKDLRYDLISMRHFLPPSLLFLLKYLYLPLEKFELMTKLRKLIRRCRAHGA